MGIDLATGLAIAQVGIGVVSGVVQAGNAQKQADTVKDKSAKQTQATFAEVQRQEVEVNRTATEQTSDRIRAANAELGTARAAALERGLSGTSMLGMVRQMAYLEGADITRIEANRQGNIAAGEATKASAKNEYFDTVSIANNQAAVAATSGFLGAVGSGLSIGSNYFQRQSYYSTLQNKVS